mgnify:CR=1 FL=1
MGKRPRRILSPMKTFYQLRQELKSEDTSEVEIMPEINSDTDDPKELKKKKAKKQKEMKQKVATEATLATARKNIGKDPKKVSCWKGYRATGTKMKGGKSVPDCKPK